MENSRKFNPNNTDEKWRAGRERFHSQRVGGIFLRTESGDENRGGRTLDRFDVPYIYIYMGAVSVFVRDRQCKYFKFYVRKRWISRQRHAPTTSIFGLADFGIRGAKQPALSSSLPPPPPKCGGDTPRPSPARPFSTPSLERLARARRVINHEHETIARNAHARGSPDYGRAAAAAAENPCLRPKRSRYG